MSERFYPTNIHYPYAHQSVLERVILYFTTMIYPDLTYTEARKRFILADVSDDANSVRRSIDAFKTSNGQFPFTAYNISDDAPLSYKSHYQVSGNAYSSLVGAYISFIPMLLTIPMTTFYTTPHDFWRGMTLFAQDESCLTRMDVPVTLNGVLCSMTIDLNYTTERGQLAFDVEQQFAVGKLFPVIHTVDIKCSYIVLNMENDPTTGNPNQPKVIYHVDDIITKLYQLSNESNLDQNTLLDTKHSPSIPSITSVPFNNATNVLTSSTIVLTFDVAMNESTVITNLDMVPYCDKDMSFDMASKVLTITLRSPLTVSTEYEILINTSAKSCDGIYLEEDYSLIFTTGTV